MKTFTPQMQEPNEQEVLFLKGLDQVTPSRRTQPGTLRLAQNVEIDINNGYVTPTGYERLDGQAAPSAALYTILKVAISGSFTAGDTVTGATTAATGVIVAGGVVTDVGADDYLVLTKITGSFNNAAENLEVSASVEGVTTAVSSVSSASTKLLDAQYRNAAADVYRADIGKAPGTGGLLGAYQLNDVNYVWRNANSKGSVELTAGASGSVDGIVVNSIEIMSGAESFDTDLATTAAAVAENINAFASTPDYTASAVGPKIFIRALVNADALVVTSSVTTITSSDVNMANYGAKAEIYKDSAAGWVLVPLGFELAFTSGGTTAITEGQTITGATSAATAVLTRVQLESGTWAAGTAAGRFIFAVKSGTFQAENIDIGGSGNLATIAGDASEIELNGSGRYEIIANNFGGAANTDRMYGCGGNNRGFEFDGTVYSPITTAYSPDTPEHVTEFNNHLFFSFGGSVQHSGIGTPYTWTIVTGAGELALGGQITAFKEQPAGTPTSGQGAAALAVFGRNRTRILYGSSSADWQLVSFREERGAFAYTVEEFGMTLFLDDRGVADLSTSDRFGNFTSNTISRLVQTFINLNKTSAVASCIARDKSQYRLFFNNRRALYITTDNEQVVGMVPQLHAHNFTLAYSVENSSGDEEMFVGTSDGYLMQMEKGTSWDGDPIAVQFSTHFIHSGAPRREKIYEEFSIEASGDGYSGFQISYELGYGSSDIPQATYVGKTLDFSTVSWDSFVWDSFFWDGQSLFPTHLNLDGAGENISFLVRSSEDYYSPIVITGGILGFNWGSTLRN